MGRFNTKDKIIRPLLGFLIIVAVGFIWYYVGVLFISLIDPNNFSRTPDSILDPIFLGFIGVLILVIIFFVGWGLYEIAKLIGGELLNIRIK